MQDALAKLAGGLHPAEEMEVEVVAAGAALQDQREHGDEGSERQQQERWKSSLAGLRCMDVRRHQMQTIASHGCGGSAS